jgi:hypothetical protein
MRNTCVDHSAKSWASVLNQGWRHRRSDPNPNCAHSQRGDSEAKRQLTSIRKKCEQTAPSFRNHQQTLVRVGTISFSHGRGQQVSVFNIEYHMTLYLLVSDHRWFLAGASLFWRHAVASCPGNFNFVHLFSEGFPPEVTSGLIINCESLVCNSLWQSNAKLVSCLPVAFDFCSDTFPFP